MVARNTFLKFLFSQCLSGIKGSFLPFEPCSCVNILAPFVTAEPPKITLEIINMEMQRTTVSTTHGHQTRGVVLHEEEMLSEFRTRTDLGREIGYIPAWLMFSETPFSLLFPYMPLIPPAAENIAKFNTQLLD
jgi:hypothetical protein